MVPVFDSTDSSDFTAGLSHADESDLGRSQAIETLTHHLLAGVVAAVLECCGQGGDTDHRSGQQQAQTLGYTGPDHPDEARATAPQVPPSSSVAGNLGADLLTLVSLAQVNWGGQGPQSSAPSDASAQPPALVTPRAVQEALVSHLWRGLHPTSQGLTSLVCSWAGTAGLLLPGYRVQILGQQRLPEPLNQSLCFTWDPQLRLITAAIVVPEAVPLGETWAKFRAATLARGSGGGEPQGESGRDLWLVGTAWPTGDLLFPGGKSPPSLVAVQPQDFRGQVLEPLQALNNFSRDRLWEQRVQIKPSGQILRRVVYQPHGSEPRAALVVLTNVSPQVASGHQVVQLARWASQSQGLLDPLTAAVVHGYGVGRSDPPSSAPEPQFLLALSLLAHNLLATVTTLLQAAQLPPRRSPSVSRSRWYHRFYNSRWVSFCRRYILKRLPSSPGAAPAPAPQPLSGGSLNLAQLVAVMQGTGLDLGCDRDSLDRTLGAGLNLPWAEWATAAIAQLQAKATAETTAETTGDRPSLDPHATAAAISPWHHLRVETNLYALGSIFQNFDAARYHCPGETLWPQCQLALAEAFSNAVRYAHQGYPVTTPIDLEVVVVMQTIEIRIWDYGYPFNLWNNLGRRGLPLAIAPWPFHGLGRRLVAVFQAGIRAIDRQIPAPFKTWLSRYLPVPVGGRGLLLMQEIADYLDYIPQADGRNCLLIIKYWP